MLIFTFDPCDSLMLLTLLKIFVKFDDGYLISNSTSVKLLIRDANCEELRMFLL